MLDRVYTFIYFISLDASYEAEMCYALTKTDYFRQESHSRALAARFGFNRQWCRSRNDADPDLDHRGRVVIVHSWSSLQRHNVESPCRSAEREVPRTLKPRFSD
jgi:hypothetical protein